MGTLLVKRIKIIVNGLWIVLLGLTEGRGVFEHGDEQNRGVNRRYF